MTFGREVKKAVAARARLRPVRRTPMQRGQAVILGLQGAAGNRAVSAAVQPGAVPTEPVVQRKKDPPTPDEAVKSNDADVVSDVPDDKWGSAKAGDRRVAIEIMLGKNFMFPWNDKTVVTILNSYPPESMTAEDIKIVRRVAERGSIKGFELTGWHKVVSDFEVTVVERARQNVAGNLTMLEEMAKKYGIGREAEGGASGIPSPIEDLQLEAGRLQDARGVQLALKNIQVGWQPLDEAGLLPSDKPMYFRPDAQPVRKQFGAGAKLQPGLLAGQGVIEWDAVKKAWDQMEVQIARTMASNPALYILQSTPAVDQRLQTKDDRLQFGKSALSGLSTTTSNNAMKELAHAHQRSKEMLLKVQGKIGQPKDPVDRNAIDVAALDEVGLRVSGTPRFNDPFPNWATQQWLGQQRTRKERLADIIDFATAAILIGATVATAGGAAAAAALLAGAATAGSVASAGVRVSNASDLGLNADAKVDPATQLTSDAKVAAADLEAVVAVATALLATAESIKALSGAFPGLLKGIGDKVTLRRLVSEVGAPERAAVILARFEGDANRALTMIKSPGMSGERLATLCERFKTVPEIETFLERLKSGAGKGLLEESALASGSKAVDAIDQSLDLAKQLKEGDAAKVTHQAAERALAEANGSLVSQGVPPMQMAEQAGGDKTMGSFAKGGWRVDYNVADLYEEMARSGSSHQAVSTFMHEAQHAEQAWTVACTKAADGMKAEQMVKSVAEGGLGIDAKVAQKAAANPLPKGSAQYNRGQALFKDHFNVAFQKQYVAQGERIEAAGKVRKAAFDKWQDSLPKRGEPSPTKWAREHSVELEKEYDAAKAIYDREYQKYKSFSHEAEAFAVEDALSARRGGKK